MTEQNQALETFGTKTVAAAQLARQMVAKLGPDASDDQWIMAESQVREVKAFAAELGVAFSEAFVDRLERGDIEIGNGRRFYAGKAKRTKVTMSPGEMLDTILESLGGDLDALKELLSSGWCKYGALKGLDPETFAKCFEVEEVIEVKDGVSTVKREPRLTR